MVLEIILARVCRALKQLGSECSLEKVMALCPELTFPQVLIALDFLSRPRQVREMSAGEGSIGCRSSSLSLSQLPLPNQLQRTVRHNIAAAGELEGERSNR